MVQRSTKQTHMTTTKIVRGNFSKGENSKGNFTGWNVKGKKIFVAKAQMEGLGITKDADFKPFFTLIDTVQIPTRDENGEITDVMTDRLQALSVFKTQEELVEAYNADSNIDIAIKLDLQKTASASGLSEVQMQALLSASI